MNKFITLSSPNATLRLVLPAWLTLLSACATSGQEFPTETPEGLQLVADTEFDAVYLRPGAQFGSYTEFGLEPCDVSFRKNWLRDQNRARIDLSSRVRQQDVDRIRDALAAECDEFFRRAMERDSTYRLVDSYDDGEPVLIVHPSIINLDVAAPDVRGAGRTYQYTTSAGEMTLLLEARDGTTGQIQARVVDRQKDPDFGYLEWTSSVSNRADADRILRIWTDRLRAGLDRLMSEQ